MYSFIHSYIPDLVCSQISKSGSDPSPDKILLLLMELMLNTRCLEKYPKPKIIAGYPLCIRSVLSFGSELGME